MTRANGNGASNGGIIKADMERLIAAAALYCTWNQIHSELNRGSQNGSPHKDEWADEGVSTLVRVIL